MKTRKIFQEYFNKHYYYTNKINFLEAVMCKQFSPSPWYVHTTKKNFEVIFIIDFVSVLLCINNFMVITKSILIYQFLCFNHYFIHKKFNYLLYVSLIFFVTYLLTKHIIV